MTGTGHSHSRVTTSVRDLAQDIDEPLERGGTNTGFAATEVAFSALIGCTNVIGHKCAEMLGIDIGQLNFQMEIDFDRRGVLLMEEVEVPFRAIRLQVTSDGPCSFEDLQSVARETDKFCPIGKLYLNSGTDLKVTWQKG